MLPGIGCSVMGACTHRKERSLLRTHSTRRLFTNYYCLLLTVYDLLAYQSTCMFTTSRTYLVLLTYLPAYVPRTARSPQELFFYGSGFGNLFTAGLAALHGPKVAHSLQPRTRRVAALTAWGCSLAPVRLQHRVHGVAASLTNGCSLRYLRLQPPLPTVAASATYGCRCRWSSSRAIQTSSRAVCRRVSGKP